MPFLCVNQNKAWQNFRLILSCPWFFCCCCCRCFFCFFSEAGANRKTERCLLWNNFSVNLLSVHPNTRWGLSSFQKQKRQSSSHYEGSCLWQCLLNVQFTHRSECLQEMGPLASSPGPPPCVHSATYRSIHPRLWLVGQSSTDAVLVGPHVPLFYFLLTPSFVGWMKGDSVSETLTKDVGYMCKHGHVSKPNYQWHNRSKKYEDFACCRCVYIKRIAIFSEC